MKKLYQGKLSIARFTPGDTIHIELEDATSGTRVVDITIDAKSLALALTGLGLLDCQFEHNGKYVGYQREVKELVVYKPHVMDLNDDEKAALLEPYQVDGWIARQSDLGNHHRLTKDRKGYMVTFTRFVKDSQ
jgi:hypothetical protein